MPAKIKQGKYVDSDGVQQNVVFIGAEKAIFDDDGTRLDNKLADMSKASGLTAEDAEGLLGTPDANVNFQALVDAIANKVMNELVTNSALTAQLANYVTKAMMSNEQVNDNDHVPTSSLVYDMNEDITQLNSEINNRTPQNVFSGNILSVVDLHIPPSALENSSFYIFLTGEQITNAPTDGGSYSYSAGFVIKRTPTEYGVYIFSRSGGAKHAFYTNSFWSEWK